MSSRKKPETHFDQGDQFLIPAHPHPHSHPPQPNPHPPKYENGVPVYAPLKDDRPSVSTTGVFVATSTSGHKSNFCSVQHQHQQHQHQHHQQKQDNLNRINTTSNSKDVCAGSTSTLSIPGTLTPASASTSTSASAQTTAPPSYHDYSKNTSKDFRGGQETWQTMLYDLMAYKVYHNNDTNVKFEKENTKEHTLYLWLQNQRKHYKYFIDGKSSFLNMERIKILECLGVEWNVRGEIFWENMYDKLKEYRLRYGDTLVPRKWEENKKLGEWVTDQRRQHKYKVTNRPTLLNDERQQKLDDLNFTWSLRNRTDWQARFEELADFKEEYGHCVVPQLFSQNKSLGKWVSKQREQYRKLLDGKSSFMTKERIDQLDNIGFSWSAKGRRNTESLIGTEMMKSVPVPVPQSDSAGTIIDASVCTGVDTTNSVANDNHNERTIMQVPVHLPPPNKVRVAVEENSSVPVSVQPMPQDQDNTDKYFI